jgi:hypothetical protein
VESSGLWDEPAAGGGTCGGEFGGDQGCGAGGGVCRSMDALSFKELEEVETMPPA